MEKFEQVAKMFDEDKVPYYIIAVTDKGVAVQTNVGDDAAAPLLAEVYGQAYMRATLAKQTTN